MRSLFFGHGILAVGIIISMSNDQEFEETIHDMVLELCTVLHNYGYDQVSIGALMRVMGVAEERSKLHDNDVMFFDEEFQELSQLHLKIKQAEKITVGKTLH